AQTVTQTGQINTWDGFITDLRPKLERFRVNGEGLRILTESVTSPTFADLMKQVLAAYPGARWHQYEPVNRDNARAGARMTFGRPVNTTYDFSKADRILSLGSDFLSAMPGTLRYARDYAAKRRNVAQAVSLRSDAAEQMSRLY